MVLAPRGAARTAKEGAGDCEPEAGREPEREAARAVRQDHAGARGTAKTASEPGLPGSGGGQSRGRSSLDISLSMYKEVLPSF